MAVQKNRTSRSKKKMGNSHNAISITSLSIDKKSNEIHKRHNITKKGYYKGKKVITINKKNEK